MRPLLLTAVVTGVLAAGVNAAELPEDLLLVPFPQASIVVNKQHLEGEHSVVLGSIRRINNELRIEREVRTQGELIRLTQQIPEGHTAREAFFQAKNQLQQLPHSVLYFCEGRECGSSSIWANQVFDFSRLYGPEENQFYAALRLDTEPQHFVSLYAITRGNRRVYLHTDQLTPAIPLQHALLPTPATLIKQMQSEGYIAVPAFDLQAGESDLSNDWLDQLNRMLRTDRSMRVVVHGAQSQHFYDGLIQRGIRPNRLEIGEQAPVDQVVLRKL
ncbi:DUF4892 domain-containing protein [Halopseudomonas salegens]|uniref:DUF4892 domain-containing protein n=1 Tax=Halopseudomonas salegens TaxID=1434072 RepID=A0A1H2FSX2_9GAMM|nr:DUF4892 domain-containing protein [Halopseudomonas salegens]SDU10048.1 protein of unknown function [Halopseudomonas salegens]